MSNEPMDFTMCFALKKAIKKSCLGDYPYVS